MSVVCEGNVCRLVFPIDHWTQAIMQDELKFAVVCSSNMNRSMEAHAVLSRRGYQVKSFGTGDKVKLPGRGNKPNCYEFGVSYKDIYNDLLEKDKEYYEKNSVLNMLMRNKTLKPCPERFQDSTDRFDIIITCEKRVFDQVVEWFVLKKPEQNKPVNIINIDIKDNLEEATLGSYLILDLATKLTESSDYKKELHSILKAFQRKCRKQVSDCIMFY